MRRERNATKVTPRQFIEVWQTSSSVADVASKLRIRKGTIRVRAHRYRKQGVPLKCFPWVELPKTDWQALAVFAAEVLDRGNCTAAEARV